MQARSINVPLSHSVCTWRASEPAGLRCQPKREWLTLLSFAYNVCPKFDKSKPGCLSTPGCSYDNKYCSFNATSALGKDLIKNIEQASLEAIDPGFFNLRVRPQLSSSTPVASPGQPQCTCANGLPITGTACTTSGKSLCSRCNQGYKLNHQQTKCQLVSSLESPLLQPSTHTVKITLNIDISTIPPNSVARINFGMHRKLQLSMFWTKK